MTEATRQRTVEAISNRLEQVRECIGEACERVGRTANEVSIVAVSKTFSLEAIEAGRQLGLQDFGENRVQELTDKAEALPGEYRGGGTLRWHMIGHLQRNKAKDIVEYADVFQALDSPRLARELEKRASREDRVLQCFAQVNITRQERKYGISPDEVHDFLDSLSESGHLKVRGLMAMAAFVDDPEEVRPQFSEMRRLFETYDDSNNPQVELKELSMGMSNDYEVAIEEGATQVRLGSAIFGPRDYN